MNTIEEIRAWVKEALAAKDQEYQLVEVVRTCIELEAGRCADIADRAAIHGHSVQEPSCREIARKIREGVGLVIEPIREKRVSEPAVRKCVCPNGTRTAIAHVNGCPAGGGA